MKTKQAIVCAPFMPEFDRESGSQRIFDTIMFLREAGWRVSFVARHTNDASDRYAKILQQRGVATYAGIGDEIDQVLGAEHFDLAILAFWHIAESYLPAIRANSPTTRIIVDSVDLHFVRNARRIFLGPLGNTLQMNRGSAGGMNDSMRIPTAGPFIIATPTAGGATKIEWNTGDASVGQVYVSLNGQNEKHFANGAVASEEVSWIGENATCDFRLYKELEHSRFLLAEVSVTCDSGLLDSNYASEMIRELNTYHAADAVLTVSEKEAAMVNDLVGDPVLAHSVPDNEDLASSAIPFNERKGILFIGNFRHAPNVSAVEYLCKDILPRISPGILAEHPVYIVGNDLNQKVRRYADGLPHVRLVGWVPSVIPYLERARISVIPLLYGAGTKRKLIQSLMIGTPTVSTGIGIEGLKLRDREHVLVADGPASFANSITRLVKDARLWERLARKGRDHILALHNREAARTQFMKVISAVFARNVKPAILADTDSEAHQYRQKHHYQHVIGRIREIVADALPQDATVAVVSKGDNKLLDLGGPQAWHFPQNPNGVYAGYYPADSAAAIVHLEALRARGANYLLFPCTSFWWLEQYVEFRQHLEERYRLVVREEDACLIFALRETPTAPQPESLGAVQSSNGNAAAIAENGAALRLSAKSIADLRPVVPGTISVIKPNGRARRKRVLVLGVYLANKQNNIEDTVLTLSAVTQYKVVQHWVALGGGPPTKAVAGVTAEILVENTPKFEIINGLLAKEDLAQYEYLLMVDDDIVLPHNFIDHYISLQSELSFCIAQPARTSNSYIDHPITEQQKGVLARQTMFVEIGPVVSFHRSVYELVFPFDLTSPMGWGYENVWSYRLAQRKMKMGIIDAVPVDHSLRKPLAYYSWDDADRERALYLSKHEHFPIDQCFKVLEAIGFRRTVNERSRQATAN